MQTSNSNQNSLATLAKVYSFICTIVLSLGVLSCSGEKKTSAFNLQKPKVVSMTLLPPAVMDMYLTFGKISVEAISPSGEVTIRTEPSGFKSLQSSAQSITHFTGRAMMQDGDHWVFVDARLPIRAVGPLKIGEEIVLFQQCEEQLLESGELKKVAVDITARGLGSLVDGYRPNDDKPAESSADK
jgi:hypothetical protein